ncbi:MAG TPA: GyrI-like domain-containing protein [Chloroflexia bacterium]|nr:GyrI-like domain-containing protein [Chloroflexia bacterium]
MNSLEVRIVRLDAMEVVSTLGFGPSPEELAWKQIQTWADSYGLLSSLKAHRFFGFNNPSPAPGSPNYGYEQWMTVNQEVKPSGKIKLYRFPGGLYAVTRCQLRTITDSWKQLALWRESTPYRSGDHQWLEECLTPEIFLFETGRMPEEAMFDLYLPIVSEQA